MGNLKRAICALIIMLLAPVVCYGLTADEHRKAGIKYMTRGKIEEAITEFEKAIEVDGTYKRARQVKNNLEIAQKVLRGNIKKEAAIHVFKAINYVDYRKGMIDEAVAECKKAIKLDPNYADAHLALGSIYFAKGMMDEAVAECKKAIKLDPNYADAHLVLGGTYSSRGMVNEGIAEFKKAVKIDPNWVEARCVLGVVYMGKGMFDDAIAQFKRAININPNWAEAHNGLGVAYSEKGMIDEGIAEFKQAIKINANLVDAQGNLGESYLNKGMLNESIAELNKALGIDPNYAPAHANLARAYFKKRDYKLAMKHCDKAIGLGERLSPELVQSIKSHLVYVYDPTGKPDPFKPLALQPEIVAYITPLQRLEVTQLTVVGILWTAKVAKAMVQDPSGKGYILAKGTLVGTKGGYVKQILKNKVIVEQKTKDLIGRVKVTQVELALRKSVGEGKL